MGTRTRSLDGCWTCRLRRKKCDELRPVCGGCAALEIDCLFTDEKPGWMDGGEKQKERAEWLKRDVKQKAGTRREKRFLQSLETGMGDLDVSKVAADDSFDYPMTMDEGIQVDGPRRVTPMSTSSSSVYDSGFHSEVPVSMTTKTTTAVHTPGLSSVFDVNASRQSPSSSIKGNGAVSNNSPASVGLGSLVWGDLEEHDMTFLMLYLDVVFPFLFPYYRPSLMDGGRGWLLSLLMRNKSLLHAALGVGSYFFGVLTEGMHSTDVHQVCKNHSWSEMQKQQELSLKELQRDMQEIIIRGVRGYPAESARVLASIVQLLTFEVAIANTGNWMMHLDAAIEIFTAIMENHTADDVDQDNCTCFGDILAQLGPGPELHTPYNHPWSSDQAAFRFFTGYLLFFDTLASTSLEQPPRLKKWHNHLLLTPQTPSSPHIHTPKTGHYPTPHIDLSSLLGIQNFVLLAIAETSTLASWKAHQKATASLSLPQLVARASHIETVLLRAPMSHIDVATLTQPPCPDASLARSVENVNPLAAYSQHMALIPSILDESVAGLTYLWAQSALTYLSVVVNGCGQVGSVEVRESVRLTVAMLAALPTRTCVRTCVWPVTITGCMAVGEGERRAFREAVEGVGVMARFGGLRDALGVMEGVWRRRDAGEGEGEEWDLGVWLRGGVGVRGEEGGDGGDGGGRRVLLV